MNFLKKYMCLLLALAMCLSLVACGNDYPIEGDDWRTTGIVRNLLDRFYGPVPSGSLKGRKFVFLFQGAAPEKWMFEKGEYTMSRFAKMYGMTYVGMATNIREAKALSGQI